MGAKGGFNPFRDAHGRFSDAQAVGGGSRETLSAPLPSKTEWSKGGVTVVFTGGRTPTYEVRHGGQVITSVPATSKWRQDLMTAQLKAEAHLVSLGTERANQVVRGMAGVTTDPVAAVREAMVVAMRKANVESYVAAGAKIMDAVNASPSVAALRARHEALQQQMEQVRASSGTWPPNLSRDAINARQNLEAEIRQQAGDLVAKVREMATRHDMNIDPHAAEAHLDLAEEAIEFFPKAWVQAASRRQLAMKATAEQRSYYMFKDQTIHLSTSARRSTMIHEMGHWIEYENSLLWRATRNYLASRTIGEEPVNMRAKYGSYTADEYTKPDKFHEPYLGKQYYSGSTEITSMMMEEMASGRHGIMMADPAMFKWWLGVMVAT